ncbi:MAG: SDR family oxidoreductase [Myxococcales bacterium]|jgi:NAD(P)-dependent dehydrogenase (short-subunit alcohol dehydrogenase family)|nr:MAG: SDR family oxidoreductase [Myxococcales bacterium]
MPKQSERSGPARSGATKLALVTGASRGIGKACAIHLARAGFDVAILARTLHEGEEREHSSTVKKSNTSPLPGSLDSTADLVRAAGREAIVLRADLLDRASVAAATAALLERRGCVDVLVNNGRYIGPGHMDRLLDTPLELIDRHFEANVLAPLLLTQLVLPGMIARGEGLVANMTSDVAWTDPPAAAGAGGWGLGYAMSKGALHRIVGILAHELAGTGVRCVNVSPGFVATERIAIDMGQFGFDASTGAPPDAIGAAVAWLATDPRGRDWDGKLFLAQDVCRDFALLPGWK